MREMPKFHILTKEDSVNLSQGPENILRFQSDLGTFCLIGGLTPSEVTIEIKSEIGSENIALLDKPDNIALITKTSQGKRKISISTSEILAFLPKESARHTFPNGGNGLLFWREKKI